ncbi:MAG TPA: hypothetical protein VKF38_12645 [Anaerolineaceae bacterium]|nr:hypothetical protein [Anaerolineaceae bacterium]
MDAQEIRGSEIDLNEFTKQFLKDHPEAKEALDLFGITYTHYQQFLTAQNMPVFYTASSTNEGKQNGELA